MKSDTDSQERYRIVISRSTVEFITAPPPKKKLWTKIFFCQKLMSTLLTCFAGHAICSSNIHVSHVSTSYGRFPLFQSLNIFVLVSGNTQQNTSAFGGNGKSGWNEQEQCIVWIPLQCGVPLAKRANSYSAAMVITCKTGESPSNGAPPKVDTHFRT